MNKLTTNWYQELVTDLKKLAFEGIVKTKWAIGKRILEDELKFGKPEYGSRRIEGLSKDLGMPSREIFRCIQLAKKCHGVTQLEFENGSEWLPSLVDLGDIVGKIGKCEDLKYPYGSGYKYTQAYFAKVYNKTRREIEEMYQKEFNPNNLPFSK